MSSLSRSDSAVAVRCPTCHAPEGAECRHTVSGLVRYPPHLSRFQAADARARPTQADVFEWARDRWPDRVTPVWRALKLGEEAGEVQGAVVKMTEGRKSLDDLAQETAQLVICAMALAESAGFNLDAAVAAEWERCR